MVFVVWLCFLQSICLYAQQNKIDKNEVQEITRTNLESM
jgi:hypothetical protein